MDNDEEAERKRKKKAITTNTISAWYSNNNNKTRPRQNQHDVKVVLNFKMVGDDPTAKHKKDRSRKKNK